ncbi:MAG: isoleucine--tRNA ligase, partial [Solirubrobacterales bacterium]|nr:isoleucine--tRNA ligase [Solirubrobacterales bacterium]
WWALKQIWDKGLIYKGYKVVPYCPRCGTALSSHEVALGYRDVIDPSVYVRLPVRSLPPGRHEGARVGDELLVWTTTPWTLPSNAAVAVDPELTYVRARAGEGPAFVVAEALVERVLGPDAEVLARFPGSALVGVRYEPPFPFIAGREYGPLGHSVLAADFVTAHDGTGLVHTALAFGEDDYRLGEANHMTVVNPVRADGTYDERIPPFAGRFVMDANPDLVDDLRARGRLLREERYEHSYPHCWRCSTPLIYYAKASWYIRTTAVRERMLAHNHTVAWHPPHIRDGRFGEWLRSNVDWALSRERYWGTPLPVWRCPAGHTRVVGSFAELTQLSGVTLDDHHRPFVDEVRFPCPQCEGEEGEEREGGDPGERSMSRVAEVIDVWFDSGAMPFAQHHAPFEGQQRFEERFPADFVCEALDQTRGWFYSLLAISTLLFDTPPYRNVLCLGLILDAHGQKMSKSRHNTVEPSEVIDAYGADAFRWYFFTSKQPWDGYRFSTDAIAEAVKLFLKPLWSTYFFYALYAHANAHALAAGGVAGRVGVQGDSAAPAAPPGGVAHELDRWVLSRTAATAELVAQRLDRYDATAAGRAIAELLDELSNWYVRRSRRRFWDGDPAAFATLRTCLLTIAKLLAPFCPFIADEIYDNLDGTMASVHLCEFPTTASLPPRDPELEDAMAIARETVRLGLAARHHAKLKIRQPLAEALVVADGRERAAIQRLGEIVREELNVRHLRLVDAADQLLRYEVKANYRRLGPLFGAEMPQVADAIAALEPARVADTVRGGATLGISVGGREHVLSPDDVILTMSAPDGYSVERDGAHAVALDLTLDDTLLREGRAREVVHAVQNARRSAGLAVEDRVRLALWGDPLLIEAAEAHREHLAGETLAVALTFGGDRHDPGRRADPPNGHNHRSDTRIDGLALSIALSRAPRA